MKISRLRWFIKGQAKEGRREGGEFNWAAGDEFSDIRWDVGLFMTSGFSCTPHERDAPEYLTVLFQKRFGQYIISQEDQLPRRISVVFPAHSGLRTISQAWTMREAQLLSHCMSNEGVIILSMLEDHMFLSIQFIAVFGKWSTQQRLT